MADTHRDASVSMLVVRSDEKGTRWEKDSLVAEEPLEIRLSEGGASPSGSSSRCGRPGDDDDLVVGLLFGEGVIEEIGEIAAIGPPRDGRVAPELAGTSASSRSRRARTAGAPAAGDGDGLGVRRVRPHLDRGRRRPRCIRAPREEDAPARGAGPRRSPLPFSRRFPVILRERQSVFSSTGGLHAAGLFEADGSFLLAREDVGRHNAADKAIGALLRDRRATPPILLVSGRLGFEIAQKAALAGVTIVAAVSAPTSLAVDLAEETGSPSSGSCAASASTSTLTRSASRGRPRRSVPTHAPRRCDCRLGVDFPEMSALLAACSRPRPRSRPERSVRSSS